MRAILDRSMLVVAVVVALCFGGRQVHAEAELRVDGLREGYSRTSELMAAAFESKDYERDRQAAFSMADGGFSEGIVRDLSAGPLDGKVWDLPGIDRQPADGGPMLQVKTVEMLDSKNGLLLDDALAGGGVPGGMEVFAGPVATDSKSWTADSFEVTTDEVPDRTAWILVPSGITLGILGVGLLGWLYVRKGSSGDELPPPLLLKVQDSGDAVAGEDDALAAGAATTAHHRASATSVTAST